MADTVCRDCTRGFAHGAGAAASCPVCGSLRLVRHGELDALAIAHLDCDAFYAAIEKRDQPALRDRPVIIGHAGGRGVVTTACYVARRFGPRSAMPMFKALALCPHAVVIAPNMAKYREASRAIHSILAAATQVFEPVSLDEAYLDLSPHVRLDPRQPAVILAAIARRIEAELGITVSIGLAANRFLAKLASDLDKPRGFSIIGRAEACQVLGPMPVRRLMGVGPATAARLETLGITTIGHLQGAGEAELVAHFGRFGRRLAAYARGEDERDIMPSRPARSISSETTFAADIREPARLMDMAAPLVERVARRLASAGLAATSVVVKLKTADFRVQTRHRRLADPTCRADVIAAAARPLIRRAANGRAFRLIGIGVSDLVPGHTADPPDLFSELSPLARSITRAEPGDADGLKA